MAIFLNPLSKKTFQQWLQKHPDIKSQPIETFTTETQTWSVNPHLWNAHDLNNLLKIIKQSKWTFAKARVNKAIKRLTFDGFFHLTKALHQISTPCLIFNSSTLPASQLLAIGFYNLSPGSEELLPLSMEEKGMLFPCHPLRLQQIPSADG